MGRRVSLTVSFAVLIFIGHGVAERRGAGHPPVLLQTGSAAPAAVTITVDGATQFQTLDGFGHALASPLIYPGAQTLSDSLRAIAIEKAFNQVGLNLGIVGELLESPSSDYSQRTNDNSDPFTINWSGFNSFTIANMRSFIVDLAKPYGYTAYSLGAEAPNVRWASPWLTPIRNQNYSAYLDEAAEQVLANVTWWKNTYGEEQAYYELGNEQLSGNRAMIDSDLSGFGAVAPVQQMVDVTRRAGARLRQAGFLKTRFLIGTEETEAVSLNLATAILADPVARQYVGAIGYHSYPYGQGYSSVSFILTTSGAGAPDPGRIAVRNGLRDLANEYGVKVWMDENSNAGVPLSFDSFRARAIQIHDEFLYANASAYFVEASMWDLASQRMHFNNTDLDSVGDEGNAVLINNDTGAVDLTGIAYAIGHYARWAKPGSIRLNATSSDALVQVSAFRNPDQGPPALVVINNASVARTVTFNFNSLSLAGNLTGEQSTPAGYWQPIPAFAPSSPTSFTITLPPASVTSLGADLAQPSTRILSSASLGGITVGQESIATAWVPSLPIPTMGGGAPTVNLAGITLNLQDSAGITRPAPLFYVSPTQINFQIPMGTAPGPATATIANSAGPSVSAQVRITPVAPGLFAANGNAQGVAAAQFLRIHPDGSQSYGLVFQCDSNGANCRSNPLNLHSSDQVYLIFYGTGIRNRSALANVQVTIGGIASNVLYAGPQPSDVGLDQVNVLAPALSGLADVPVILTVDGLAANTLSIGVQ